MGPQTEPALRSKDIICVHTMVGYLASTDAMFKRDGYGGTESHFGIGGVWGSDLSAQLNGVIYQWQDLNYQADANLEGNPYIISIETADNAPQLAKDIRPWTDAQVEAMVRLIADLCKRYDIPPKLIPDTKPGRRGLAFHAQGIEPRLVDGGRKWSLARGKECPGPVRIQQFMNQVIPLVQKKLNPPEEDIMASKAELREIIREELRNKDNITIIARELLDADVMEAPDVEPDKTNKFWKLRSALNRIINNTESKETPDA